MTGGFQRLSHTDTYFITVTSHERPSVSHHREHELADPHITRVLSAEVQASRATASCSMFALIIPLEHQRITKETENERSYQLHQYLSYKLQSGFIPTWMYVDFFCFLQTIFWAIKNILVLMLGLQCNGRRSRSNTQIRIKLEVNRGPSQ